MTTPDRFFSTILTYYMEGILDEKMAQLVCYKYVDTFFEGHTTDAELEKYAEHRERDANNAPPF